MFGVNCILSDTNLDMIEEYVEAFASLRTDKNRSRWPVITHHQAPHKPLLLLAVLDLFECQVIQANLIEVSGDLMDGFDTYWGRVMEESRPTTLVLPFYHMRSEGFWHLVPFPGKARALAQTSQVTSMGQLRTLVRGAKLDRGLFRRLLGRSHREILRRVLVETYFTREVQPTLEEARTAVAESLQHSQPLAEPNVQIASWMSSAKCKACGKDYLPKSYNQVYCTWRCREREYARRRESDPPADESSVSEQPVSSRKLDQKRRHAAPRREQSAVSGNHSDDGEQCTFRDEWEVFSGRRECPEGLSVTDLNLPSEVQRVIEGMGISTLAELLDWTLQDARAFLDLPEVEEVVEALSVVGSEMRLAQSSSLESVLRALTTMPPPFWFDLAGLLEVRRRLETSGMSASESWQRLVLLREDASPDLTLDRVLTICQCRCKQQEWEILRARFGLVAGPESPDDGTIPTLQRVAEQAGVTRERVRQIQQRGIEKLQKTPEARALANSLRLLMEQQGGLLKCSDAAQRLCEFINPGNISPPAICHLAFDAFEDFRCVDRQKRFYQLKEIPASDYDMVSRTAFRKLREICGEIDEPTLTNLVLEELSSSDRGVERCYIKACIEAHGWLNNAGQVRGWNRTLHGLLVEVLHTLGRPAHHTAIAKKLNELGWLGREISERNVHARMGIRPDLFVCVDRGTYGLVEWGLEPNRITRDREILIADLVEEFMEQQDKPCNTSEIVAYVLSRKKCRDYSVMQRLTNDDRFHRFGWGLYGLKKWVF